MSDTEQRCATCVHWGNDDSGRLKSCSCPKFIYGYWVKHDDILDDGAAIEDDEGWGMVTGPAFGCIHWMVRK